MKNSDLHEVATELIKSAMIAICDEKEAMPARDINTNGYLQQLNKTLM